MFHYKSKKDLSLMTLSRHSRRQSKHCILQSSLQYKGLDVEDKTQVMCLGIELATFALSNLGPKSSSLQPGVSFPAAAVELD